MDKGFTVLSDVALTEAEQLKLVIERSKTQTHNSHASGSGAVKELVICQGFPMYQHMDLMMKISWKSSEEDDEDEVNLSEKDDDNDNNDDDDDDADNQDDENQDEENQDDDDDEQTDSDNDGDNDHKFSQVYDNATDAIIHLNVITLSKLMTLKLDVF
ncbi:hypothetical protein Tco_1377804 [Tanacetum coccineum]